MSNDRRLKTYLATAAAVASTAGVGSVAGAAVVTSTSVGWAGWSSGAITLPSTGIDRASNLVFGDAFMDNAFKFYAYAAAGNGARNAYMSGRNLGNQFNRNKVLAPGNTVSSGIGVWSNKIHMAGSFDGNVQFRPTNGVPWFLRTLSAGTAASSVQAYCAFRIAVSGGYRYGYFDLTYSRTGTTPGSSITFTINGWAYESTVNASIQVVAAAVPGGAGLAALACGAAGLRGRRRVA